MNRVYSIPKQQPRKPKPKKGGRARPDEPLLSYCEIGRPGVCDGRVVHRHHIKLRSAGGSDDRDNTLDVCEPCHTFAHRNREIAKAHGWIRSRWGA